MRRKVVFAGYNFFSSVFEALLARKDVEVVLCLTGEVNSRHIGNVVRLAKKANVPVHHGKLTPSAVSRIRSVHAELILCAAYSYRIPVSDLGISYNLNLHPTLLPHGRGPNPLPYLVAGFSEMSGLTLHEMTDEFDLGSIVAQQEVPVESGWGFNELAIAMYAEAPKLVHQALDNLEPLFANRRVQGEGSYWPKFSSRERTIDWSEPAHTIANKSRRFGSFGVLCQIEGKQYEVVRPITFVRANHDFTCGRVMFYGTQILYIAVLDGIVRVDIGEGPGSGSWIRRFGKMLRSHWAG